MMPSAFAGVANHPMSMLPHLRGSLFGNFPMLAKAVLHALATSRQHHGNFAGVPAWH